MGVIVIGTFMMRLLCGLPAGFQRSQHTTYPEATVGSGTRVAAL